MDKNASKATKGLPYQEIKLFIQIVVLIQFGSQ